MHLVFCQQTTVGLFVKVFSLSAYEEICLSVGIVLLFFMWPNGALQGPDWLQRYKLLELIHVAQIQHLLFQVILLWSGACLRPMPLLSWCTKHLALVFKSYCAVHVAVAVLCCKYLISSVNVPPETNFLSILTVMDLAYFWWCIVLWSVSVGVYGILNVLVMIL